MTRIYIILSYIAFYTGDLISKCFGIDKYFPFISLCLFQAYCNIMQFSSRMQDLGGKGPWEDVTK